MKRLILIISVAFMAISCGGKKYTVTGNLEGLTGQVRLIDVHDDTNIINSVEAWMYEFTLEGEISEPRLVMFSCKDVKYNGLMVLEPGNIVVKKGAGLNVSITGTKLNEELIEVNQAINKYVYSANVDTAEAVEYLTAKTLENKDNVLGAYLFINTYRMLSVADAESLYSELSASNKQDAGVVEAMAWLAQFKKTEVGQKFIPIEMPQMNGDTLALADIVAANKYTMINFWTGWSESCLAEFPNMKEVYSAHHENGFEIYGVSLDEERQGWIRTFVTEKLSWKQVGVSINGDKSAAADYAIITLPTNFLIDQSGTIVAKNLRGQELVDTINELMGAE